MLAEPEQVIEAVSAGDALANIEQAASDGGNWIVALSYQLGEMFEPSVSMQMRQRRDEWPCAILARCNARLEYHHASGTWTASEDANDLVAEISDRVIRGVKDESPASITGLEPDITRAQFESMVAHTVELIHAGDIFQANIAQRFSAQWSGSARAILRSALKASKPRYGAYLESDSRALVSMSPELFIQLDRQTNHIVTRPIKGTRAFHEDAQELLENQKDAAELHMIVDLMRNDLGRISCAGEVQVRQPRMVESHETVHHCVAEIEAKLRTGISVTEILQATFPPGSITGAPKVRAMQVIDELEPVARGPYCGAVGLLTSKQLALNVAIRTISMTQDDQQRSGGTLHYSAGCGIVAESVPAQEYQESLHKSAVLLRTAQGLTPAGFARST